MRIGIFGGDGSGPDGLATTTAAAAEAREQGFHLFAVSQIFGADALTTLAAVGREVPDIELATAVVPTWPRHPMMLAAQALTAQQATGNRVQLGIGLSHQIVVEGMWGMSFDRPLAHMREYLSILVPLLHGEAVGVTGEWFSFHGQLGTIGVPAPPVLVAALGPKMLELAGRAADGTSLWMTGPVTIAEHTVPTISKAAEAAGRPAPRIAAGVPVCVTDDVDGARGRADQVYAVYGQLPSYRAMMDREGVDGPAGLALVGDESTVTRGVQRYADAGVTDLAFAEFASGEQERRRTRDFLRSLL